jgi:hypothetical protein
MMVSVVNGYVCFSSCDEAKAKRGTDPNAKPGTPPDVSDPSKKSAFAEQPSVILDGTLKSLANGARPAGMPDMASDTNRQLSLNILA